MSPMYAIAAVIAAAGQSTRMGKPKQLLPWGDKTVIETVVNTLGNAGVKPVVVVAGRERLAISNVLAHSAAEVIVNPDYASTDTLQSYQYGLNHVMAREGIQGALLSLCDQPHVPVSVIRHIVSEAYQYPDDIVIPSYEMRRGHPLYVPASLWQDALALEIGKTLRDLLTKHANRIRYTPVGTPAILQDIDTPEDYAALLP